MRHGLPHFRRRRAGLYFKRVRWLPGFVRTLVLASLGSALCLGAAEPKTAADPELPPRRAPAEPGKFDRAKLPPDRARLPVASERARLIVLADMGNEPDEEQQMLHLLMFANEFDVEGLIAVTGKYLRPEDKNPYRQKLHPELFTRLIDGYAKVYPNLTLHAAGWPMPEYLHSIVASGQPGYGIAATAEGKANAGSKLIIDAVTKADEQACVPFSVYTEAKDRWTDPEDGKVYDDSSAPIWRWRTAMWNDFKARMDWCVQLMPRRIMRRRPFSTATRAMPFSSSPPSRATCSSSPPPARPIRIKMRYGVPGGSIPRLDGDPTARNCRWNKRPQKRPPSPFHPTHPAGNSI